jgi:hypothetical protein
MRGTAEVGCSRREHTPRKLNDRCSARHDRTERAAEKAIAVGHYYNPQLTNLQTESYPASPARQGPRQDSPM